MDDDIWYFIEFSHCGREWDMVLDTVEPDVCPECGTVVEPISYEKDVYGWNMREYRGIMQ